MTARALPNDTQAEEAVLGACLVDPDAILRVASTDLKAEEFYNAQNGRVFAAMLRLTVEGKPTDSVTVSSVLGEKAMPRMLSLMEHTTSTANVVYHAEIVKARAYQRNIIAGATEIVGVAYAHDGAAEQLADKTLTKLLPLTDVSGRNTHHRGSDEATMDLLTRLQERADRDPNRAIKTGLVDLDRLICEIEPGFLHVVVAKTSVGKSTYMENVAEYNAARGNRVVYYDYELGEDGLRLRQWARWSGVPRHLLRENIHAYEFIDRSGVTRRYTLAPALDAIREWQENLTIVNCIDWTAERIAADIQRMHARGECDLAIVDYLQMMPIDAKSRDNRAAQLGEKTQAIKNAGLKCRIPVLLGSQVRRGEHDNGTKRPSNDDIRNSGEVAEKASQIVVLHRPEARIDCDAPEETHGSVERLEIHVEKNAGAIGSVTVGHILGRFKLTNWQREE